MNIALLHKFPHWSEVLSVFNYSDNLSCEFVSHKKGIEYTDPIGTKYFTYSRGHFTPNTPLIINGSIHLETHPLSKGKIPYSTLPYKIAIEHTTGYSPWDFLQMVELAEISAKNDPEYAQGSKVLYLMNKKCYSRFMSTEWGKIDKSYYEKWKSRIEQLVNKGYIVPTAIEPSQFWLESVPVNTSELSNNICICVNWCNINQVKKINQLLEICEKLYKYTGLSIDLRLHSYSKESLFHVFKTKSYINLIPYESMSKYDLMDKYNIYFVDGTGLGYEIAYRNKFNNRDIDIFYLSGLNSDESLGGFDGIVDMNATPQYNYLHFLNSQDTSNFSNEIINESFPHTPGKVVDECSNIIIDACNKVYNL